MRLLISEMILSEERLKRTAHELSAATGSSCLAVRADVRDPKQVQAAVKQTIERFGRIDFVINGNCPEAHFYLSIPH
jgi:NAD(P)-dependent dehydrogenase (short-subunit alcohol dehydrogenase family)